MVIFRDIAYPLVVTVVGVVLGAYLTLKLAKAEAKAQGEEQARISRQLSLIELQEAFDTLFANDLARWQTLHDWYIWMQASDDFPNEIWATGVNRALDHLDKNRPKNYTLVDPALISHLHERSAIRRTDYE